MVPDDFSGQLGSGATSVHMNYMSTFSEDAISGLTPCGMDIDEYTKAINLLTSTHSADDEQNLNMDFDHNDLHHLVYNNWHAYYFGQGNVVPKRIKRRKIKTKLCHIDDCMRHLDVPRNLKEVLLHEFVDEFLDACELELSQQDDNETWTLVPRTPEMNVVGSTWAFDIKRDNKKRILRFKARLCAQGFAQVKGIDYFRKYSHTVPIDVLRLFMANRILALLQWYQIRGR